MEDDICAVIVNLALARKLRDELKLQRCSKDAFFGLKTGYLHRNKKIGFNFRRLPQHFINGCQL